MSRISNAFNPTMLHPNYLMRNRLLEQITSLAPRLRGRLMDFGCGQKPYRSLFTVEEYIGVDFENPGHPHLNESIDVFYDGKSLPFPDNHFDSIFASEVFEHVFNLPEIMLELNRVLKPGGSILITCPFAFCEHEVPNDFARYSSFAIRSIFESNGFEIFEQVKTANSIEVIFQLWLTYFHLNLMPFFRKIPVVRSLVRFAVYGGTNLFTIVLSKLFPKGKELYLNNVVLCQKVRSLNT